MKELIVISGKGGTGKTSLTAAFANLAANIVLCDADVDAADLFLITEPRIQETHIFKSGHKASIMSDRCSECGLCLELCRFNAIREDFTVDQLSCEGCGVCVYFCPEKAIAFPENTCGEWYISETRMGPMVHARLNIAEENSGKLVALVRGEARKLAENRRADMILTDGPPGIGCPVIAAIGGASAVLIVTEPTVSGRHDMDRVIELARYFKVPAMVCINKYDLNPEMAGEILAEAERKGCSITGRIPFDSSFVKSMVQKQTVIEYDPESPASKAVKMVWERVVQQI